MSNIFALKREKITTIILILFYRIILDISYILFIHPVYSYEGFSLITNPFKMVESYLFTMITVVLLPCDNKLPSSIVMNILNLIMIIPIYSIYAFKDEPRIYAYGAFFSVIIGLLIIRLFPKLTYYVKFSLNRIINTILIVISVLVYIILIYFNGLPKLSLFDFNNVYIIRSTVTYGFTFMSYLVPWLGIVINPYLIIHFYKRKNKSMLSIVVFSQIILYLLTSQKSFLFYPILLLAMMFLVNSNNFIKFSIAGVISVVLVSVIIYFINNNSIIPRLTVYRTLYLPAQISFQYYEYFSQNGLVLLSHSIFERFFSSPVYDIHPIRIIGQIYYYNNFPNTGYLGDAYMNFGVPGMIVFTIILSFILKLIDGLSVNEEKTLTACAFTGIMSIQFCNTGLLTTLLTGGLFIFVLLLWVYKDEDDILPHIEENLLKEWNYEQ